MFPAQMATRGPHVAAVVFPRRRGAKAGRPISKPRRGAPGQSPPRRCPPTSPSLPFPSGLGSACGLCFCTSSPSPQPLPPTGLGQGLRSSGFGFQWLSSGCRLPQALRTLEQGLKIVGQENMEVENMHPKVQLPKLKPKPCLLQDMWPRASIYPFCASLISL